MKLDDDQGLTVIIGLGITGLSCIRYLVKTGVKVAVSDSRQQPPGLESFLQDFPNIPSAFGEFNMDLLNQASSLVISPGISLQQPEIAAQIARGIPVIGDIELFARVANAPIVAITGSNGKTTVTTLMGKMITEAGYHAAVGGNIGEPALNLLSASVDYYVLELSSFQLETTYSLQPATSVVLNISEDHMDRYHTLADYTQAKQRIYMNCRQPVINSEEPQIWESLSFSKKPISFGLNLESDYGFGNTNGKQYLFYQGKPLLNIENLPLRQPHHLQNALACLSLGSAIGLPQEAMIHVLTQFTGLPHRCQYIGEYHGIAWYNDSKGTNVGATLAAINSMGVCKTGSLILIAGGDAKCADLSPLISPIQKYINQLILLGKDAPLFYQLFQDKVPCTIVNSLEEAVSKAKQIALPGDTVLLSPACSSLDMFTNYEQRGNLFMQYVKNV